jgi:hypothetical protein
MQNTFIKSWIHEAFAKSAKQGGIAFIEEIAEGLTVEQLEKLIGILNRVLDKRKNTIPCGEAR